MYNAFMDALYTKNGSLKINHKFFNPQVAWQNKWKNGDPKQGERFFLSSTLLVWVTSGWHLAKLFMFCVIAAAVAMYKPIYGWKDYLILLLIYFLVFETSYRTFKKVL